MKVLVTGILIVLSALIMTGCVNNQGSEKTSAPQTTQKVGDTTKTGQVISANGSFFLMVDGKQMPIDSYAVELDQYAGQTVTVTGQYSGDTLFVGKIE